MPVKGTCEGQLSLIPIPERQLLFDLPCLLQDLSSALCSLLTTIEPGHVPVGPIAPTDEVTRLNQDYSHWKEQLMGL